MGIRRSSTKDALLVRLVTCLSPLDSGAERRQARGGRRYFPLPAASGWPPPHRNE